MKHRIKAIELQCISLLHMLVFKINQYSLPQYMKLGIDYMVKNLLILIYLIFFFVGDAASGMLKYHSDAAVSSQFQHLHLLDT